jgi:hypothetical protein
MSFLIFNYIDFLENIDEKRIIQRKKLKEKEFIDLLHE